MTKQEAIEEIEEYIQDADKAISDDEEFIHGWKSAMLTCLELVMNLETDSYCLGMCTVVVILILVLKVLS
jgi:hypothetical protein